MEKLNECPECNSAINSRSHGGNDTCFHCGICGYVQCMDPKYFPVERKARR